MSKSELTSPISPNTLVLPPNYTEMKLITLLSVVSLSAAFVPHATSFGRPQSSTLHSSAVSETYTFAKSEEIFTEAKEVRSNLAKEIAVCEDRARAAWTDAVNERARKK